MRRLNEDEERALNAFTNLVSVDAQAHKYGMPTLSYSGIVRAVSESINHSIEETKILIKSAIEKNPSKFREYFAKHSFY